MSSSWKIALSVAVGILLTGDASAGEVTVANGGGFYGVRVTSLAERRNLTVIRQEYDFSCGAAAVATLLTYHYGRTTPERVVFKSMYAEGDQKTIKSKGFSMLDMKRYLDRSGYHADGFRLALERLAEIGVPAITLLDINGYKHFVVVKGIRAGRVVVGDPAFGTTVMDEERFRAIWSGTILAIRDRPYEARTQFNKDIDWNVRPSAPLAQGMSRDTVSSFTLSLPGQVVF